MGNKAGKRRRGTAGERTRTAGREVAATRGCPDCGSTRVVHPLEWSVALFEAAARPFFIPFDLAWHAAGPLLVEALSPLAAKTIEALAALRLGTLTDAPDRKDSWRTRCLWEEAARRGIRMREFRALGIGKDLFIARARGRTICFDGLPRPGGEHARSLAWMDDKGVMRKKFAAAGIPVARGGARRTPGAALRLFRALTPPVIVKPSTGSRSRHTTVHLASESELIRAFRIAKKLSPWAVIEEELAGFVHRITLVHGKVAAVIRREPAHIVGDGARTVRALAEEENAHPARHGAHFHPIPLAADAEAELARQGFDWASVPEKGALVFLGQKVGRGEGGSNTDVTDLVHPENRALFEKIAATLEDPLVGVDFIIADIAKPWRAQPRMGVIECNSLPFIDLHHYPLRGEARNVAGDVWEMIFPSR